MTMYFIGSGGKSSLCLTCGGAPLGVSWTSYWQQDFHIRAMCTASEAVYHFVLRLVELVPACHTQV